ncbi:MAG: hypothetical protein H6707_20220 [Deltaproteobacteria bacterium]|nr:hypothetical protein [Deltaproteobacteria bacterium]
MHLRNLQLCALFLAALYGCDRRQASQGADSSAPSDSRTSDGQVLDARASCTSCSLLVDHFARTLGAGRDPDDSSFASAVAIGANQQIFVAGGFRGRLEIDGLTASSANGGSAFIVALSSQGKAQWLSVPTSSARMRRVALTASASGELYVAGGSDGAIRFGQHALDQGGGFLARLDEQGGFRWALGLGGADEARIEAVATDVSGAALVAGWFVGTSVVFGKSVVEAPRAGTHAFVAKVRPDGLPLWTLVGVGDYLGARAFSVASAGDGAIYVTGNAWAGVSFGARRVSAVGENHAFLLKISRDGDPLWLRPIARRIGSGDGHCPLAAQLGSSVVLGGYFNGPAKLGTTSLSGHIESEDAFLAGFGSDGAERWALAFGSALGRETVSSVAVAEQGALTYAVGTFEQPLPLGQLQLRSNGASDGWLVLLNSSGALIEARALGGQGHDGLAAIDARARQVAVVGTLNSVATIGGQTLGEAQFSRALVWVFERKKQQDD